MRTILIFILFPLVVIEPCMGSSIRSNVGGRNVVTIETAEEPPLPEGVVAVEYIGQSDNQQRIETGIVPPQGSILRCEFQFTKLIDQLNVIGINYQGFGFGISGGMFRADCFDWITLTTDIDTEWHVWTIDEIQMKAYIDEVSMPIRIRHSAFGSDWEGSCGFTLFRRTRANSGYSDIYCNGARCRSLYIGTSSEALFDGIAVRFVNELGEDEGALYDFVSGKLFRNSGSGKLVFGGDL